MDNSKAGQLLAAATKGDVAHVRHLLAAGVPVDTTDVNRSTAAMLAAQAGHPEVFRVLVDAGADLNALAFRQVDLLEMAARGGSAEIVRFLLDHGQPVDGHWNPTVEAQRKLGHSTPLIEAATAGHDEIVRMLLAAGADRDRKYEGKTALQRVNDCLRDPIFKDAKEPHLEIASLLGGVPTDSELPEDTAAQEVARFPANAQEPAFSKLLQRLGDRCGNARAWQPVQDHGIMAAEVKRFTLRQWKQPKVLTDLQEEVREAGFHLALSEMWAPGENAELVLFPTRDKFAVVAAVGTEGANYGHQTADVIAWLHELDRGNPFALRYCGHDLLGGAFFGPVKDAKKLAERMTEFCPSILDGGIATAAELSRILSKSRIFLLRWD